MVALQCIKLEEGIDQATELGPGNWLPLNPKCKGREEIEDSRRVQDIFVGVNMAERQVGVNYVMRSGEALNRYIKF